MELIDLLSVPSNWSRKYDEYEVYEEEININSSEGLTVRMSLLTSSYFGNVTKITRSQNPFLYHRYQIRKEEYKARGIPFTEQTLLHATSKSKVPSILKNNLDWRLVNRSKFGRGVSFSPDPVYANTQSSRMNGSCRAMILTKVLVGNSHGGSNNKLPMRGYDTTTGNGTKVYVKYYDDEFYPEYVAYYNL